MIGVRIAGSRRRGARVTLAVCLFGFADQLVRLVLRHLAATNHVLNEVARAFDGESGQPGGGVDHVFHGRGHLAPGFETDLVGAGGHLGDGVPYILPTMPGTAARGGWCRRRVTSIRLRLGCRCFFRHRDVPGIRLGRGHRDD